MMARANSWTVEEEEWLRAVYPDHFNDELPAMHAERFPDRPRRTEMAVHSRAGMLGLRKREGFDRNARRRGVWTDERVEWLRSFAPGHDIYEIVDEFERVHGIRLTKSAMKNAKLRFGARSGMNAGQFQKGHVPASKGRTWDEMGISERARENMRRGQFKKGGVPHNGAAVPVGTERASKDGYVMVKVAELHARSANDQWRMKHVLAWERANGCALPPHHMVVFADGDKGNFDPENLVAVPRALWAIIQRKRIAYWDAESLGTAVNIARLVSARHAAECRPRECRRCGAEFAPRYARQRTCDACLGRVVESGSVEGGE